MQSQDRAGMARRGGGRGTRGALAMGFAAIALLAGAQGAQAATAAFDEDATATVAEGTATADTMLTLNVTTTCALLEFGDTTFAVTVTPGTATAPADLSTTPVPSQIVASCSGLPGTEMTPVKVAIKADALDEADAETFTVSIADAATPATAQDSVAVSITDDDLPPVVTIASAPAATEGTAAVGPGLKFPVTLSAPSGRAVTVAYATTDGTATQPADYLTASGTLTIPAGQTTGTVSVAVNADAIDEDDETVTATISAPANATLGATATRSATGTITDDDTSTLSVTGATVTEGAAGTTTPATATIKLSTPSAKTVSVGYATVAGSATATEDYVPTTGTVTFAPGQTTGTIPVTVNGDAAVEPDEVFGVTLSAPVNATITAGTAVMGIKNDDVAPVVTPPPPPPAGGGTTTTPPGTGVTVDPGKVATIPPVTTSTKAPIRLSAVNYKKSTATLRYDVRCPDAAGRCKGTVTVFTVPARKSKVKALRKEQKLGSKRFDLAAGQTVTLSVKLTKAAKGWLRSAKSFKVIAYAVASTTSAGVSTAKTTGTIRK